MECAQPENSEIVYGIVYIREGRGSFLTWPDASQGILGTDQDNNGGYAGLTTHYAFWLVNNGSPH